MIPVELKELIDFLSFADIEAADANRTPMWSIAWDQSLDVEPTLTIPVGWICNNVAK